MNVELTPELEELLDRKVKSGHYSSASEIVTEALRLLEHRDEIIAARKQEFHEKIDEGWQAARRNELIDGDEVSDRIDAELEAIEHSAPE